MHVYNTRARLLWLLFHYTPLPRFSDRFWRFPCLLFLINNPTSCSLWNVLVVFFSKYQAFSYWSKSREGTYIKLMFCMNHFRPKNRRHSCIRCRSASCCLLFIIWSAIQATQEENWSQTPGKKKWRQRNMNYWTIKCLCLNILLKFNKLTDLGFFGENLNQSSLILLWIFVYFSAKDEIYQNRSIFCVFVIIGVYGKFYKQCIGNSVKSSTQKLLNMSFFKEWMGESISPSFDCKYTCTRFDMLVKFEN